MGMTDDQCDDIDQILIDWARSLEKEFSLPLGAIVLTKWREYPRASVMLHGVSTGFLVCLDEIRETDPSVMLSSLIDSFELTYTHRVSMYRESRMLDRISYVTNIPTDHLSFYKQTDPDAGEVWHVVLNDEFVFEGFRIEKVREIVREEGMSQADQYLMTWAQCLTS